MKSFLYDLTNFGIIWVDEQDTIKTSWEIHMFRACILDIGSSRLSPRSSLYKDFTNDSLKDNFYVLNRNYNSTPANSVLLGEAHEVNEVYEFKKQRANLIAPLIKLVTSAIMKRSLNKIGYFPIDVDDTIAREVENSDPAAGIFSTGILEYANTLGITPQQAYEELRIDYQTTAGVKMRSYAMSKKYQSLIRDVNNKEDADRLRFDIEQKLLRETYI